MHIRTRFNVLASICAAAASIAVGGMTAGSVHADAFYGPSVPAGSPTLPTNPGAYSQPLNIYSGGSNIGEVTWKVIEVPFNSSSSGTSARTYPVNGSNAQRIYFQAVGTASVRPAPGQAAQSWVTFRIIHFTQSGQLCLDADGSNGVPAAGSSVTWFQCDPNFANQPNQLWLYRPSGSHPAIYNLDSVQAVGGNLGLAPVLNAGASGGTLSLQAQQATTPQSAGWLVRDMSLSRPPWGPCDTSGNCTIAVY